MRLAALAAAASTALALAPAAAPPALLRCCDWQRDHCARTYGVVRDWYENDGAIADLGNWGVDYRAYVEGFVADIADGLDLEAGSRVFESAVGEGWLLRGLEERLPAAVAGTLRYAGNDISPVALEAARDALASSSSSSFCGCVGDSLNLSWVDPGSFDAALCGYVECGTARTPAAEAEVTGRWVAEMARLVAAGGRVFVGNVQRPRERPDAAAGLYLRPPSDAAAAASDAGVTEDWWRTCAESDCYGWGVDPASVRLQPLADPALTSEWGLRYHVFMRRRY